MFPYKYLYLSLFCFALSTKVLALIATDYEHHNAVKQNHDRGFEARFFDAHYKKPQVKAAIRKYAKTTPSTISLQHKLEHSPSTIMTGTTPYNIQLQIPAMAATWFSDASTRCYFGDLIPTYCSEGEHRATKCPGKDLRKATFCGVNWYTPTLCPKSETAATLCADHGDLTAPTHCPDGRVISSSCPDDEIVPTQCPKRIYATECSDRLTSSVCPDDESVPTHCYFGPRSTECPDELLPTFCPNLKRLPTECPAKVIPTECPDGSVFATKCKYDIIVPTKCPEKNNFVPTFCPDRILQTHCNEDGEKIATNCVNGHLATHCPNSNRPIEPSQCLSGETVPTLCPGLKIHRTHCENWRWHERSKCD